MILLSAFVYLARTCSATMSASSSANMSNIDKMSLSIILTFIEVAFSFLLMRIFFALSLTILSFASVFAQQENCSELWFEGEGTQYGGVAGGEGGNCGIPVDEGDFYHCAMNHVQYDSSAACGACVRVLGPKGEITLKVVDRCPECLHGDIDLSTDAFIQLAELKDGRIPIKWRFVPCDTEDDIKIFYAEGTSPYYFKAQFRGFRHALSMVEYQKRDGSFIPIHREMYNYFVMLEGIDEDKSKCGPYTFRLTAVSGESVIVKDVPYIEGNEVSTGMQFQESNCPDCSGVIGGTAEIDNCGVCSGGTTGIEKNSSCKQDCIGYWNGEAYLDECGFCVGGTTGGTPCPGTNTGMTLISDTDNIQSIDIFDVFGRFITSVSPDGIDNFRARLKGGSIFILKIKGTDGIRVTKMTAVP
ncbi:MAG: hypothetical protein J6R41_11285 [Paludibacteraceae bacterium]|nr:hypothetical protein [Paludibacteraceae bacterium]